jgi:hypothetical protein
MTPVVPRSATGHLLRAVGAGILGGLVLGAAAGLVGGVLARLDGLTPGSPWGMAIVAAAVGAMGGLVVGLVAGAATLGLRRQPTPRRVRRAAGWVAAGVAPPFGWLVAAAWDVVGIPGWLLAIACVAALTYPSARLALRYALGLEPGPAAGGR